MKKIMISALSALCLFSSCGDDFLNRYPKGQWHHGNMPDNTIDNSILVEGKLIQAYNDLRDWNNCWPVFAMHNMTTPEGDKGSTPNDGADLIPFTNMSFVPSSGIVGGFYGICYATIYKSNEALTLLLQLNESHPKKQTYKAEALFMRALMYYRLTQAYGDVPYIDRVLGQNENVPQRLNKDEIRAKYTEELKWAIPFLPTRQELKSTGNSGRATQNAARAILAKTYMYQQNWGLAKDFTSQIIASGDNDLSTPFEKIFLEDFEYGPESVLEAYCEQKPSEKIYQGSPFGQIQGWRGEPNLGWGFNVPSKSLRESFDVNDPRKIATIISEGDDLEGRVAVPGAGAARYSSRKAYSPVSEFAKFGRSAGDQGNWKNIRVIRYSDILLMHAEACCELGDEANINDALSKLEMVRNRARGGNNSVLPQITTKNQEELRDKIRLERKYELALEFERYFDLVRWGIAKDVIPGFITGKHEVFPIPQSEIDRGLTQNPGY